MSPYLVALGAQEEEGGFEAPSSASFIWPPLFEGIPWLTRPVLQLVFAALIVGGFFLIATRRATIVPGKLQFAAEGAYTFIRNGVGRDIIGAHDFMKFVPWLFTLFYFVLLNNLFGIIPILQFPTLSRAGVAYVLAGVTWLVYNLVGMYKHGILGYWKHLTWIPGVPLYVQPLLVPIEFVSNLLVRPVTLALRIFANMFAGHLLLLVFILGGEYLLLEAGGLTRLAGIPALLLSLVFTFFEALVQTLQAYIFVLLSALYVAGSLAEEH